MNQYAFIDAQKATYPIWALCRALNVPESSYYDWNATGRDRHAVRAAATAELVDEIRVVHAASDRTYGSPRVHDQLVKNGRRVGLRRVAEVMSTAGIVGVTGRKPPPPPPAGTGSPPRSLTWSTGSSSHQPRTWCGTAT